MSRDREAVMDRCESRWSRMLRFEWFGQTLASVCWICSMFFYGFDSAGDWLQLCAASSWFLANVYAALVPKQER
ncbi:MAG: hypothetical protein AAGG55_06820 [Pseudomonadota bacterium]